MEDIAEMLISLFGKVIRIDTKQSRAAGNGHYTAERQQRQAGVGLFRMNW